ncbi:protein-tyrosine-phosphatase [Entamoeba marina]
MLSFEEYGEGNGEWEISEIVPNVLFLGARDAAESEMLINKYNIQSVLSIVGFVVDVPENIKHHKWVRLEDNPYEDINKHFQECFEFIHSTPKPVLVHCEMGMSRSSTIVIGYLMKTGKQLQEAFEYVQQRRSFINPNNGFWYHLYELSKELYGENEESMIFIYKRFGISKNTRSTTKTEEVIKQNKGIDIEKARAFVRAFSKARFNWGNYYNSTAED